ncbi:MAG: ABC transporter ATP-binding protein [Tissierellia bacterium]|nr:ABC transporter ATP-binding protein [Tissierellia bacterium]
MAIIETKDIVKKYNRGNRDFIAVNGVNFTLEEGDFIHIIGRSGSGKSTFLNLLAGILDPDEGDILVEGKSLCKMGDQEKSWYRNSMIGYVPQSLGTMPNLTVLENVRLPYFLHHRQGDGVERASILLDWMGILHLKDTFPSTLSGGELKRVLLARALMNSPKVLIADEPTADIDSETTIEIMNLLKKINEDSVSLIVVTHELDTLSYGSRVLTMRDGKLKNEMEEIQ